MRYNITVEEHFPALISLRLASRRRADIERELGFALPVAGCSCVSDKLTCVSMAADEWLLIVAIADQANVFASLEQLLDGDGGIAVITSDAYCCMHLRGPDVLSVLTQIVPIDLDAAHFAVGHAARTAFGRSSALIFRRDEHFDVYIDATLARYGRKLLEACADT